MRQYNPSEVKQRIKDQLESLGIEPDETKVEHLYKIYKKGIRKGKVWKET
jgi:hypothetical protein